MKITNNSTQIITNHFNETALTFIQNIFSSGEDVVVEDRPNDREAKINKN